jgi:hypothetical protein
VHLQPVKASFQVEESSFLFAHAFNASILALIDAAIPLRSVPEAVVDRESNTAIVEYYSRLSYDNTSPQNGPNHNSINPVEEISSKVTSYDISGPDTQLILHALTAQSMETFSNIQSALHQIIN